MGNTIAILILVGLIFLCFYLILSNYHFKLHCITFFQGDVGAGKTAIMTRLAINKRRLRVIFNWFVPVLNFLVYFIPFVNLFLIVRFIIYLIKKVPFKEIYFLIPYKNTDIYSTYPIYINKKIGYSYVIDRNFYRWDYRVNHDNPIIVTDEMGYLMPSEEKKASDEDNFTLTWIRHGCDPVIYASSQNLGECLKAFRNKCSHVYLLTGCSRSAIPFLSKVYVKEIMIVENLTNEYDDNSKDFKENVYRFHYPKKHFKSRYGKNFYKLSKDEVLGLAKNYDLLLKRLGLKAGDKWTSLYYEF